MGANPHKKKTSGNHAAAKAAQDPLDLVAQAEEVFAVGDVQQAEQLMGQALAAAPNNPTVLTAFGSMLADAGNAEKAILTLRKAVSLESDSGFEKFMYLGQLLGETDEAEEAMTIGISILKADIEDLESNDFAEDAAPLREQLCCALCSLAELRLQRCADIADVAVDCELLLNEAMQADPTSPEPLQALASLRYEQGRLDEALATLRQSMAKWWKPVQDEPDVDDADQPNEGGASAASGPGAASEDDEDEDMADPDAAGPSDAGKSGSSPAKAAPSYEFRFECAKLLIEVDESTETAVEVLEDLLAEYDDAPDTWHLLSLAYYGGGLYEEAAETLEYGFKLIQKLDLPKDSEVAFMYDELKERIEEALKLQQDV